MISRCNAVPQYTECSDHFETASLCFNASIKIVHKNKSCKIKEIVYQSVPYVGMAKAFDFVHATNEFLVGKGIQLPLESQSTTSPETRYDKGLATQKAIFGEMIDKLYEQSPKDQLHIQRYLSANCFGDFYTRNGLDIRTRELITLSILIAFGGVESQIKGHIQGNVNVGNGRETLLKVITQLLSWVGYPRTLNALKCLNERSSARVIGTSEGIFEMHIKRNGSQPSMKGQAEYFTATVRIDPLFQASDPARTLGASVTFEPCARTAWHTHPLGQILIVTSGCGLVQSWGGPIEEIRPGDVVWCPPGEKHWHGAMPTTAMPHIAIVEQLNG